MTNGISCYTGLNVSPEENIALIEKAADLGLKRLFTSALIPEATQSEKFFEDFTNVLVTAVTKDFEIILDVNPDNYENFDFEGLTLRLDDGFTPEEIATLSNSRKILINASTVTKNFLEELKNLFANFENISALHNFYPHPITGLDTYFFADRNEILKSYGMEVGAFVASGSGRKRPPLCEGLPTLEDCRNFSVDLSARFLAALGTDFIIIGDGLPADEELKALAEIESDEVKISAKLLTDDVIVTEILKNKFTRRPDISKSVIRAVEGRKFLKATGGEILPDEKPLERNFGDITIDNSKFGRYAGEVQIIDDILPPDERVNVVAKILPDEIFLTGYIKPGQKFSFKFI